MCDCFEKVDAALAEQNSQLQRTFDLHSGTCGGVIVATEKVDTKKRGNTKRLVASFCPFCGESLSIAALARPSEEHSA